jgi:starch synthase (maltosyl-transferring)
MKIDLLITELDVGGAEKCLVDLALFLAGRGHSVRVISLAPKPKDQTLPQRLQEAQVPVAFLECVRSWQFPRAARSLRRLVVESPPDMAQSFLFHANVVAAWVYPRRGIPLVGGHRVAEPNRIRHALGKWAASQMIRVVCVSGSVAQWCHRHEGLDLTKLVVIPNGIELDAGKGQVGRWAEFGLTDQEPWLLYVGRLHWQKGIDRLIAMAPDLLRALPEHHLVLLGDGPLGDQARQLAKRMPGNRMHVPGWMGQPRSWMAASQLLIHPARYEGMPNAILEAMAEGCCVSATAAEGVLELLGDLAAEQAVEIEDWDAWFRQTVRLAMNSSDSQRLGQGNRERVAQHFRLADQMAKYEQLYQEVLP